MFAPTNEWANIENGQMSSTSRKKRLYSPNLVLAILLEHCSVHLQKRQAMEEKQDTKTDGVS